MTGNFRDIFWGILYAQPRFENKKKKKNDQKKSKGKDDRIIAEGFGDTKEEVLRSAYKKFLEKLKETEE